MANFLPAVTNTLNWEGGLVDNPNDPGGWTDFGISIRWLRQQNQLHPGATLVGDFDHDGVITPADIKAMTRDDAIKLYQQYFWLPIYDQIGDQELANKVFDFNVNMGSKEAHILLQRACRACGHQLTEDGAFGPATLAAVNSVNINGLVSAYRSEAAGYYRSITAIHEALRKSDSSVADFSVFINGWLKRAYA